MNMIDKINKFVDVMIEEKSKFEIIQNEVTVAETQVQSVLDEFKDNITYIISDLQKKETVQKDNKLSDIFNSVSQSIDNGITTSTCEIKDTISGMEFIKEFEKTFTVAVFGKVKAGKSYIGNFIKGNIFKKLNIDTSYSKLNEIPVRVYDRGNISEQEELSTFDEDGIDGFKTGITETTSSIQLFQIGAMTWFDTPGIGSVTFENEMLAKDYVKNADLVIYACNSDAAGTRQDFSELKQLMEMKKPVLLLLTQSDTSEEDEDENGEVIAELIAKPEEDRNAQKNYMLKSLEEYGMKADILKYAEIINVSAKLANVAIESGDEEKFQDSNMGKLLDVLISITLNEAADMKRKTPGNRINTMINTTIHKFEEISASVEEMCDSIEKNKKDLIGKKTTIIESIKAETTGKIIRLLDQAKAKIEAGAKAIDEAELNNEINKIVNEVTQSICSRELKVSKPVDFEVGLENVGKLEMKKETVTWEEVNVERRVREPRGFFENIFALFGKEYHENTVSRTKKSKSINIGVNSSEITGRIMKQLEEWFKETVNTYIDSLCEGYYEPVEELNKVVCGRIKEIISILDGLKIKC